MSKKLPLWAKPSAGKLPRKIRKKVFSELKDFEIEDLNSFNERAFLKMPNGGPDGVKAYWIARGGYLECSTTHVQVIEVPRDILAFHVVEYVELMDGKKCAELVDAGAKSISDEIRNRITLMESMHTNPTAKKFVLWPAWAKEYIDDSFQYHMLGRVDFGAVIV